MASVGLEKNTGLPRSAFEAGACAPISRAWSAKLRPTQYTRRTGKRPPPRTGTRTCAGAGITSVMNGSRKGARGRSVGQGVRRRLVDDAVLGVDHGTHACLRL